jgi:hypothetical protein
VEGFRFGAVTDVYLGAQSRPLEYDHIPALLRPEEMVEHMAGSGRWDFQPYAEPLVVSPCESPLVRRPGGEPRQGELF